MNVSQTKVVLRPLAFVLAVAVSPWGLIGTAIPYHAQNFPLIDDWAYFRGACSFFHDHQLDYQNWASMPLIGQWLWSVPFLATLGDSYLATRASTIVLSWLGLWAFFTLLRRQAGVSPRLAAFATTCLAWNPYFFVLSGTFMTDVPALSLSLIALALYAHALDSGRRAPLAAAVLVALLAVATRQNAIAAPLTAGVLLLGSRYRTKPLWLAAVAAPAAFALVLNVWLAKRSDAVPLRTRAPGTDDLYWLAYTSAHYLGLLAAPLLLLLPPARLGKAFWAALAVMAVGALWLIVAGSLDSHEGVFPYVKDLFLARGTYVWIENDCLPLFDWHLRLLPTALGCLGAAVLAARAAEQGRQLLARPLVIFSLLQLAALAVAPKYYDRYLLPLVPGALAAVAWEQRRPWWKTGLAALVLLGGLSTCLMHDWLAWNAARWDLGRRTVAQGNEPHHIMGGFEWDHCSTLSNGPNGEAPRCGSYRYRLSLSPPRHPLVVPIDNEPFTQWLPPRKRAVYLQQFRRDVAVRPQSDGASKEEQPSRMD